MTKLLEKTLEAVRQLPPDSQDEIARAMLTVAGDEGEPEEVDPAHLPAVLGGLAQAKRREFATDAEVEAAFRRESNQQAGPSGPTDGVHFSRPSRVQSLGRPRNAMKRERR